MSVSAVNSSSSLPTLGPNTTGDPDLRDAAYGQLHLILCLASVLGFQVLTWRPPLISRVEELRLPISVPKADDLRFPHCVYQIPEL